MKVSSVIAISFISSIVVVILTLTVRTMMLNTIVSRNYDITEKALIVERIEMLDQSMLILLAIIGVLAIVKIVLDKLK